jgi:hypothetical protein
MSIRPHTLRLPAVLALLALAPAGCDRGAADPAAPDPAPPTGIPSTDGTAPERPEKVSPPVTTGTPILGFVSTRHDFGKVNSGAPTRHRFEFENVGSGPLLIETITSSCACLDANVEPRRYEPGERGFIDIVFSPEGDGTRLSSLVIAANTEPPVTELHVQANVQPFGHPNPQELDFGDVDLGSEAVLDLVIGSPDLRTRVVIMETTLPFLSAQLAPEDEQPRRRTTWARKLKVTLSPDAPWGPFQGHLIVHMFGTAIGEDAPRAQRVKVRMQGVVRGRLEAFPATVSFPGVDYGLPFRTNVLLTAPAGQPFAVSAVRVEVETGPEPTVEVREYGSRERVGYRLTVGGQSGNHVGLFKGFIVIETDVEGEEQIRLPYQGVVINP